MSNTIIQLKHSTEVGNVPSGLVNGEIAINTFDGKIFYRDPSGITQSIQNFPGPSGLDGEIQFNDSGDLGSSANLTFNRTTGNLSSYTLHTRSYVEFPDGTKQYTANGGGGGESITITVGLLPPASGNTVGDVWIDSNTGIQFTWIDDGDSKQWIELGPVNINVEGGGSVQGINVIFDHANSAYDKANSANILAQAAFDAANNAGSSAEIQTIYTHANSAFDKANSANLLAQNAYDYANSISLVGYATETYVTNSIANLVNSAPSTLDTLNELAAALGNDANFSTTVTNLIANTNTQATLATTIATSSYAHSNGAFDKANSANVLAQAAYNQANTGTGIASNAYTHSNGAFDKANSANVLTQAGFDKANSANVLAQAAYNKANSISLVGYATETYVNNAVANLVNSAPAALDTLNELASALGNDANFSTTVTNLIGSAYNQANSANVLAQQSYNQANTGTSIASSSYAHANGAFNRANAANILAQSSYTHSNGSFDKANSANLLAQAAYNQANTGTGIASNAYTHANGAFNQANSANVLAQSSFDKANSANVLAQAAYNQANTANLLSVSSNIVPSANITYDLGTPTRRWRDLYLSGNTIDLAGVQISANNGTLSLPPVVAIGNTTIDGTSGGLILPSNTSIGGSAVATPRVTIIDYPGDDTAADPAGGQVIGIVGSGFQSGASVILDGQTISVVTYVNSQRLEITTPAKATGSYIMYIVNPDGGTGIFVPGVQYSGVPEWQSPAAGSLGSVYETNNVNATFSANSDSAVTYSLFSGTLPPGSTLNSSTGVLSGTAALTDNATTYNFTIRATDGENQDTDRAFSLTINPDVITWVSPANGASYQVVANSATSVSLSATSAAGDSVVYTANALPTGISISGSSITGTPTTEQTLSSLITARGNTTNSTATIVLNWSVVVRDLFFNQTTLLLNANTNTWITDESPNGFEITPAGDAKPSAFSPFNTNWSNFFDGTGDNLTTPANTATTIGTSNFTFEAWINPQSWSNSAVPIFIQYEVGTNGGIWIGKNGSNFVLRAAGVADQLTYSTFPTINTWTHVAITRSGSTVYMFYNGLLVASGTSSYNFVNVTNSIGSDNNGGSSTYFTGHISNLRLIKGTALYTSNFTPSTSPLTAVANTVLLTCQSNRFIDNSTNNFAITRNGDVRVTSFGPFTETDTTTGSGYFDGTGDYLMVPDNQSFNFGSGDFTIETWIYFTSSTPNFGIFNKRATTSVYSPFNFGFGGTLAPGFLASFSGSTWDINYASSVSCVQNQWNHLAVTRSGSTFTIWVNGVNGGTRTSSSSLMTNSTAVSIGASSADGGFPSLCHLSNVRMVKGTALYTSNFTPPTAPATNVTNTQLLTLQNRTAHNNNTFLDDSGNKFNITRNGNATQGSFSPFSPSRWSAYFDGSGDYLSLAGNSIFDITSGNFSVEVWIFRTTNGVEQYLFSQRISGSQGWEWRINATNLMSFFFTGGSSFNSVSVIPTNVWTHLAVTRESNTVRMFINGVLDNTATFSNGTSAGSTALFLGYGTTGGGYFQGNLSNARLVKGTALYTSNFTPSTTPLEPIANTVLLTCRSNRFEDEGPNRFTITRNGDTRITSFSPFGPHTITPRTYSAYFDGSGDRLRFNSNSAFSFGTSDFTVEYWANFNVTTSGTMVDTRSNGTSTSGYSDYLNASSQFNLFIGNTTVYTSPTTLSRGVWYHIAVARQGTTMRIFINGALDGFITNSTNFSNNNLTIGDNVQDVSSVNGHLSNVRILKGTALYTSSFTPSTIPLTAVSNTSLLICQSDSFVDNSNNNFLIPVTGNVTPSKYNPFGETVATNVQYSPTVHGGSSYHDGVGDYLTIPPNSALAFGTGDFTIEFWLNSTVFSRDPYDRRIIRCIANPSTGAGAGFGLALNGDPSTGVGQLGGGTEGFGTTGLNTNPRTVCDGAWHHIVFGRKSSMLYLFLDGILQGSVSNSDNITDPSTYNTHIGWFGTAQGFYNGYLSNFKITKGTFTYPTNNFVPPLTYTNTRNVSSLDLNFSAAGISDATSKNVLETVGDVEVITESPYSLNQSVYFDGSGDYLVFNSSGSAVNFAGSYTFECFFNLATNLTFIGVGSSYRARLIAAGDGLGGTGGIEISIASANSSTTVPTIIGLATYGGNGPTPGLSVGSLSIPLNTWHHITVVRNSSNLTAIFLNGTRVGSTTITGTYAARNVEVGGNNLSDYAGWFPGYISNLRIVKDSAIYDPTQTSIAIPTAPLTAITNTSLLTCHSNRFIDGSTNNFTITRNGDAKITSRGPFTETRPPRSLKFDGNTDYVKIVPSNSPNIDISTGDFTIECFVYYNSFINDSKIFIDVTNSSTYFQWNYSTTTGMGVIVSTTTVVSQGNTNGWSTGTWYHVALVRNGNTFTIYRDGISIASGTRSGSIGPFTSKCIGGSEGFASTTMNGYLEDFRITKYARYTSNFTPPTTTFLTF